VIAVSKPYSSQDEGFQAAEFLENSTLVVTAKRVEILEETPPSPYTTATLLEDANTRLNFDADRVMHLAQLLFEGVELYGTPTGLITYHRTDSLFIAPEAQVEARKEIAELFGKSALPERLPMPEVTPPEMTKRSGISDWHQNTCFAKSLVTLFKRYRPNQQSSISNHKFQQSHEAIRPTSPKRLPDSLVGVLDENELVLYRLIWERFIASQMKAARYRVTTVELEAA
jgi:DNA topoisomerase-1